MHDSGTSLMERLVCRLYAGGHRVADIVACCRLMSCDADEDGVLAVVERIERQRSLDQDEALRDSA